jgi:hypothetical protein
MAAPQSSDGREPVVLGVVATPGMGRALADRLAEQLPAQLGQRFPGVDWRIQVDEVDPPAPSAHTMELMDGVHRRLLDNGWELGVGLTELPLRAGRRPVTAHASAAHGVGLVSVPALGAVGRDRRLRAAVVGLIERLLGEGDGGSAVGRRLHELASPLGHARQRDDGSVRFVGAALRGNLRLLVGMVRANEPTRLIVRMSRALVVALGTAAFAMVASDVWKLADGMSWPRLALLGIASVVITCVSLVLAHGLWERASTPAARERVIVFNLATWTTLALGVLTLYGALFAITLAVEAALIAPGVLERAVGHGVDVADYVRLAWLTASLATVGGALGSMIENDLTVRDAADRTSGEQPGD